MGDVRKDVQLIGALREVSATGAVFEGKKPYEEPSVELFVMKDVVIGLDAENGQTTELEWF